jgi:hypothetical protein
MNYDAIQRELEDRIKSIYLQHFPNGMPVLDTRGMSHREATAARNAPRPDIEAFRITKQRLTELKSKVQAHRKWLVDRRIRLDYIEGINEAVRVGVAQGLVFVSFDVERCVDRLTREIGFTIYRSETGEMVSRNFRIEAARREYFSYGATEIAPLEEIFAHLLAAVEEADFLVGHSLLGDFKQLQLQGMTLPQRRVLDTHLLANVLVGPEEANSLVILARRFGLGEFRAHNGGNDARITMELLLRMVD